MIYVVESCTRNAPLRLARGPSLAAYATPDAAGRSARALGGIVREYAVARAATGIAAEALARSAETAERERDGALAELARLRDSCAGQRARYGARDDETTDQWLARLHRAYRALQAVRAALEEDR